MESLAIIVLFFSFVRAACNHVSVLLYFRHTTTVMMRFVILLVRLFLVQNQPLHQYSKWAVGAGKGLPMYTQKRMCVQLGATSIVS